jgi:hypothetical protein
MFPEFRKRGSPLLERDNSLVTNLRITNTETEQPKLLHKYYK